MAIKKRYANKLEKMIEDLDNAVYVVEENGKQVVDERNPSLPQNQLRNKLENRYTQPIQQSPIKQEERTWFSKGAFDDGFDVLDIPKVILGTVGDVSVNALHGIVGMGEKAVDLGAYGVAGLADLFGKDEYADRLKERASKDNIGDFFDTTEDFMDKYSVLGERTDSLGQSAGELLVTAALQSVGVPWQLTTGASSFSGALSEGYQNDATDGEAVINATINAGAEVLLNTLFKIPGIEVSGSGKVGNAILSKFAKEMTNTTVRNMANFGINLFGEGIEETVTTAIQRLGQILTYEREDTIKELMKDEEKRDAYIKQIGEKLWSPEALDQYGESFIGGMALGGVFGTKEVYQKTKAGRDLNTGYTQNEQKIIDSIVNEKTSEIAKQKTLDNTLNKAITERETSQGGILSENNKNSLRNNILAQIESGEIDTSKTKLSNKEISKIKEEVENNLKNGKYDLSKLEDILTPTQTEQIKKLEEMYKNSNNEVEKVQIQQSINEKRTSKLNELNSMVKDNQFLNKAVYEAEMSLQKYSYDDTKVTDEYEKGARDSATKFANNTTETRNFVDNISKLAKDRQTHYRFTNNQELLEQGDLVENTNLSKEDKLKLQTLEEELKTVSSEREELEIKSKINEIKYLDVGGFVRKNIDGVETVLINVDSKQSLNAVVGHETKHLLEKNSLNKEFNELLFEYAESKGDLKAYRERIERLYEGIDNADIDGEVAAALTGDYLFTDSQFVENLLNSNSTNSKSIFQKIKDLIDDLVIRFKGTEQEKQLREVQKKFKELYKENATDTNVATKETKITYSLSEKGALQDSNGNDVKLEVSTTKNNRDLMVMHGLTVEKAKGLLELGGLPIPSIGITKSDSSVISQYGDVLFLFDKNTIDPANKLNEVYASDVYSKRFPQTIQKINEKELDKLGNYLDKRLYAEDTTLENYKSSHKNDIEFVNKFLEENNIVVDDVYKNADDNYGFTNDEAIRKFVIENDISYEKLYSDTELRNKFYELYREFSPLKGFANRKIETWEKIFNQGTMQVDAASRFDADFNTIKNGAKQVVDVLKTNEAKRNLIKEQYAKEYDKYLDEKLKPIFGQKYIRNNKEIYTPSGNRRSFNQLYDEYTLDNIVKQMKGKVRGEEGFFYGAGTIRSQVTPQFRSIEEIRANKNKLVTSSEMKNIKEEIDFELNSLSEAAKEFGGYSFDSYEGALNEIASLKRITNNKAKEIFADYGFNDVSNIFIDKSIEFLEKLKNAPTEYFEAKPQRAIGFDEVKAALVPKNVDEEFKQQLRDAGLNVVEYDKNIEGDKQRIINQFDDLKFSLSNSNEEIAPIGDYNVYGKDIKYQKPKVEENFDALTEMDLPMFEQQTSENFKTLNEEPYGLESNIEYADELNLPKTEQEIKATIRTNLGLNVRQASDVYKSIIGIEDFDVEDVKNAIAKYDKFITQETNESLKNLKKAIRSTRLDISYLKSQDSNFKEYIKGALGYMRLGNTGTSIDSFYQEMSDTYPDLLPKDIITEEDQFVKLYELSQTEHRLSFEEEIPLEFMNEMANDLYNEIKSKQLFDAINEEQKDFKHVVKSGQLEEPKLDIPVFNNTTEKNQLGYIPKDPTKESSYDYNKIAEVLTTEPTVEKRKSRLWAWTKANILDKGAVFEDLSLKNKNRDLMGKWDYTLTATARGQNTIGEGHYRFDSDTKTQKQTSKSLNDIRTQVDNSGLTKDFYNYMYHKHNVDRMKLEDTAKKEMAKLTNTSLGNFDVESIKAISRKRITEDTTQEQEDLINAAKEYVRLSEVKNKPVFGDSITSQRSEAIVRQYEYTHPEFMDWANDVYDYVNADRQILVDNGVISQETADKWQKMYPHYVPIRRTTDTGLDVNVPLDTRRTGINSPVKLATGGNSDILPLFDTMAMRTLQTYKATAKNSFGVELKNTIGTTQEINDMSVDEAIDSIDNQEGLLQEGKNGRNPTFTVFENGEKVTFDITQDMYDALKPISDSELWGKTIKPLNIASNLHRGVLTEYNPVFMITNVVKDVQEVMLNSQHAAKTYTTIPEATVQLFSKGYWYQEYINNGGQQNSYFDNESHTFKTDNKGIKKILDYPPFSTISALNNYIEMTPRLAEYIASRKAGRSIEVSMLDAARVTTNFKAGGDVTKWANRNGATFLNASVQGAMQQVRNVREANTNGIKGWVTLASKFALAGVVGKVLNDLIWGDDEEYEELSDYVKQNYYVVAKNDDGTFIRIPKGRTVAVIQESFNQMENLITGDDEVDLANYIDLVLNNLAPNNPIENNILSPIVQIATNKAWYGGDLVPSRLQKLPTNEQYDESTDSFSKWLGEKTGWSPYKINYLLDQYSGGIGDVFLPMMTPEAKNEADSVLDYITAPLTDKFTTNSTLNNQNISDFYDLSDELTIASNKTNATDEDKLKNKYINSVNNEMNELYKEKREIQNSDLSNKEKYNKVLDIQAEINELAENALSKYKNVSIDSNYSTVGDMEYYKKINDEGEVEWSKIKDEELEDLDSLGLSNSKKNSYFKAKSEISSIVSDYKDDKEGISGFDEDSEEYQDIVDELSKEKQKQIIEEVLNTNLNDEQKAYLYSKYYSSEDSLDNIVSNGTSMNDYLTYKLDTIDYVADKDEDGDTVDGSLARKKIDYLLSSGLSTNDIQTIYENDVLGDFDNPKKHKGYKAAKNSGVDINTWLDYSSQEFEADYNAKGNAISGSRKKKVISYVNSLDLSIPQKAILIKSTNTFKFNDYNNQIVDYVSELDMTYDEKVYLLGSLDMTVYDDGTVKWK